MSKLQQGIAEHMAEEAFYNQYTIKQLREMCTKVDIDTQRRIWLVIMNKEDEQGVV
jgi:hypothetical protein